MRMGERNPRREHHNLAIRGCVLSLYLSKGVGWVDLRQYGSPPRFHNPPCFEMHSIDPLMSQSTL